MVIVLSCFSNDAVLRKLEFSHKTFGLGNEGARTFLCSISIIWWRYETLQNKAQTERKRIGDTTECTLNADVLMKLEIDKGEAKVHID